MAGGVCVRKVARLASKWGRYGLRLSISGVSTSTMGFVLLDIGRNDSMCYGCIPFWGYLLAIIVGTVVLCGIIILARGLFLIVSSMTKA